jgi:predicted Zn-dependent protease
MSRSFRSTGKLLAATAAFALVLPSSGDAAQSAASAQAISAKDRQQGAEAHPQLVAEFGGALTGPQATYVETIGKNMAIQTGLANSRSDFTVTLLNSSVDNAFAIPGGYIYVTRQLVGLMNNEAELGGVLGHEWAHISQRHSAKRQSTATRNAIIGILGQVLGAAVGGTVGGLLSQGAQYGPQILTLKYSRTQETEADNYGIEYLRKAGYDPRAMSTVLQSLANQNALDARLMGSQNQVPEWASTHPDPGKRVAAALSRAGNTASGVTNRDTFLTRISGLTYGDDPKQGVVEGRRFIHPDLKLTFEAPNGFFMVNGTRSVSISGQSGKGEFTGGQYTGDLDAYVRAVFAALAQSSKVAIDPGAVSRTAINGIPAATATTRVNNGSSQVDVTVFAYELTGESAFHFMTIVPAGSGAVFDPMFQSMRRISASEAAAIRPRKLAVVAVKRGDTLQSLAAKMAYTDAPLDRFLVLNGLTARSSLVPGQKVKLVIY